MSVPLITLTTPISIFYPKWAISFEIAHFNTLLFNRLHGRDESRHHLLDVL